MARRALPSCFEPGSGTGARAWRAAPWGAAPAAYFAPSIGAEAWQLAPAVVDSIRAALPHDLAEEQRRRLLEASVDSVRWIIGYRRHLRESEIPKAVVVATLRMLAGHREDEIVRKAFDLADPESRSRVLLTKWRNAPGASAEMSAGQIRVAARNALAAMPKGRGRPADGSARILAAQLSLSWQQILGKPRGERFERLHEACARACGISVGHLRDRLRPFRTRKRRARTAGKRG